jgi:hypothetical protein
MPCCTFYLFKPRCHRTGPDNFYFNCCFVTLLLLLLFGIVLTPFEVCEIWKPSGVSVIFLQPLPLEACRFHVFMGLVSFSAVLALLIFY